MKPGDKVRDTNCPTNVFTVLRIIERSGFTDVQLQAADGFRCWMGARNLEVVPEVLR